MDEKCECCDLLIASCGKQAAQRSEAEAKQRRAALLKRGWFAAKWPGACRECGEGFEAGDLIKSASYGHPGYFAECCSEVFSGRAK
jgi:hypothetical protein